MTHLSSSEFVDFAEGGLHPERAAHVEACAACRARAADLRDTLQWTSAFRDVPEPSPLFWKHFSARIREAVATEAAPRTGSWLWSRLRTPGLIPVAAALACVLAIGSAVLVMRDRVPPAAPAHVASVSPAAVWNPDLDTTLDSNTAEAWAVLTAAAADLEWDAAHAAGMAVQPAAVDRAVQRLSAAELNELGRLLQSELKRSGD